MNAENERPVMYIESAEQDIRPDSEDRIEPTEVLPEVLKRLDVTELSCAVTVWFGGEPRLTVYTERIDVRHVGLLEQLVTDSAELVTAFAVALGAGWSP